MSRSRLVLLSRGLPALLSVVAVAAGAQSFMVQCPSTTPLHPSAVANSNLAVPLTEAAERPIRPGDEQPDRGRSCTHGTRSTAAPSNASKSRAAMAT